MKTLNLTLAVPFIAFAIYCIEASVVAMEQQRQYESTLEREAGGRIATWPSQSTEIATVQVAPKPNAPKWKPITITVYGNGYQGQGMNGGGKFDHAKMTCAVPVQKPVKGRHKPIIPYGTVLQVKYGAKTVNVVVTDTCIGGTLDLTKAAMKELTGKTYNRVQGEYKEVKK